MKCKNCQSEMKCVEHSTSIKINWCSNCGALQQTKHQFVPSFTTNEIWEIPDSVENTKKLVQELIKCKKKHHVANKRLNQIEKSEIDKIDWMDDERK